MIPTLNKLIADTIELKGVITPSQYDEQVVLNIQGIREDCARKGTSPDMYVEYFIRGIKRIDNGKRI